MDELMLLSTYLPWVRHQIGRLFAGPLSSAAVRAALPGPARMGCAGRLSRTGCTVRSARDIAVVRRTIAQQGIASEGSAPASRAGG